VKGLPNGVVDAVENDEQRTGQFICQVMRGKRLGIIEDLAGDVWDEIKMTRPRLGPFFSRLGLELLCVSW
jgi:hypothetical protein